MSLGGLAAFTAGGCVPVHSQPNDLLTRPFKPWTTLQLSKNKAPRTEPGEGRRASQWARAGPSLVKKKYPVGVGKPGPRLPPVRAVWAGRMWGPTG